MTSRWNITKTCCTSPVLPPKSNLCRPRYSDSTVFRPTAPSQRSVRSGRNKDGLEAKAAILSGGGSPKKGLRARVALLLRRRVDFEALVNTTQGKSRRPNRYPEYQSHAHLESVELHKCPAYLKLIPVCDLLFRFLIMIEIIT